MNPLLAIRLYRNDWLRLAGWIEAKQADQWPPDYVTRLTEAIKDAAAGEAP